MASAAPVTALFWELDKPFDFNLPPNLEKPVLSVLFDVPWTGRMKLK